MSARCIHVVGFDDAPFERAFRGDVRVIGAVFAGERLDGVLSGRVRRDGANSTRVLAGMVRASRFFPQLHAVLLQGITFAGFNVVDLPALHALVGLPVLVVSRRQPDNGPMIDNTKTVNIRPLVERDGRLLTDSDVWMEAYKAEHGEYPVIAYG